MKFGVSESHWDEITNIIKKHLGSTASPKLYVFGSRVKETHRIYSDIDLLLVADSYDHKALQSIDFGESDLPYIVDFVLEEDLYQKYKDEIMEHKVLISSF